MKQGSMSRRHNVSHGYPGGGCSYSSPPFSQGGVYRYAVAQRNERGSDNKVTVVVKCNSHYALGNSSSLGIISCLIEPGNFSSCVLFMSLMCINKNYISWQKQ